MWSFLKGKGLPEKAIAAAMGNIEAESEFNENLIEAGNGIGFGLCQWSFERRTKLEAYGKSLNHQLNFMWAELSGKVGNTGASLEWINKGGYLSHDKFMKGQGSIPDLTKAMCFCWERPNAALAHLDRRIKKANEYYNKFKGTAGTSANVENSSDAGQGITIEATNYQVVKGSEKTGDTLYGRRYRITVSDSKGNAFDVSQLHCTFDIVKTIQMEPNTSEITIYNLDSNTENKIMMNGVRVTVEAGYEGSQFGLIFDGDILQTIREKENANTYKLTIIALDSDRAINFDISNFSVMRGQTARSIVNHITKQAVVPMNLGSISDSLKGQKLTRGKVIFGKTSDYLRQVAKSNNLKCYMDNGVVNLIDLKELPKDTIFELNPKSGLIDVPEQTDFGISGQCLLNPQIKLNTLIHIDNSLVRAKRIEFNNNNAIPASSESSNTSTTDTRNKIIAEGKQICDDPNVQYSQEYRGQTVGGIKYWDCSSFVKHCYKVAGLEVKDITWNQYAEVKNEGGKFVSQSEAKPGDMVFWGKDSDCHHIAIYAGDGHCYAARGREGKAPQDQVAYHALYGSPEFGRPKCLIDADKGKLPSANSTDDNTSENESIPPLFRSLDKDGIYRIIRLEYIGDTRGNEWYTKFETIDQLGGVIPAVSS